MKFFSPKPWNQSPPRVLTGLGSGSIPLILLYHLLFQLDPQLERRFYTQIA